MIERTDQRLEYFLGEHTYGRVAFLVGERRIEGKIQEVCDGWIRVEESPPRFENGFSCAEKVRRVRISQITIVLRIDRSSAPFLPEDPPPKCKHCGVWESNCASRFPKPDVCETCVPFEGIHRSAAPPEPIPDPPPAGAEVAVPTCACTIIVKLPGQIYGWRCGQCEERNPVDRKTCKVCGHEKCVWREVV